LREKDWAAVRREERRELPQPVVIVHSIYADKSKQVRIFEGILLKIIGSLKNRIIREL
jgi:hypothetical protein